MTAFARGWRRSSGSERLPRLRDRKWRVSPPGSGASWRTGSPSSDSIFVTRAPPSARSCAQNGTAMNWPNSTTSMPAKGRAAFSIARQGSTRPSSAILWGHELGTR